MKIYHGSEFIIEKPEYGKGKKHNDYGLGFYCTKDIELAKEWSVTDLRDGYANEYELDTDGLKILYLNSEEYNILHWLTILVRNRKFIDRNNVVTLAKKYLTDNFSIDTSGYDLIIGYRADDSYFRFAQDFLSNIISIGMLTKAMKLGNLGEQIVLVSKKAFEKIEFVGSSPVSKDVYAPLRNKRNEDAKNEYLKVTRSGILNKDELLMIDIIRQEIKENDIRLR
ncbi:MAG: DUF3990 domain-containing protein [Erysipelotrichaceae bacterium]|nr:DUF3990 domain-containing protein [Erysipelotrichaceae bacterium]